MKEDNKIDYLDDGISMVSMVGEPTIDPGLKTVNAARISYNTCKSEFDEKDKNLTEFLWSGEHTSPFRHSHFTFHIKTPLFVARQFTKYQVGSTFRSYEVDGDEVSLEAFDHFYDTDKGCSWNEVSGRYTQTSQEFYLPKELRSNPGHGNKQSSGEYKNPLSKSRDPFDDDYLYEDTIAWNMEMVCKNNLYMYNKLIKNGVAKELARTILPQGMYTEIYWTASLQAIIWFLHQRLKKDAQYEIRMLAEGIYDLMKPHLEQLGLKKEDL